MFQHESWAHHRFLSHEYPVTARSHSSHVGLWLDCDEGGTSTHESTDAQTRRAIPPDFEKTRMYSSEGGRVVSWCGKGIFEKTRKTNIRNDNHLCPCLCVSVRVCLWTTTWAHTAFTKKRFNRNTTHTNKSEQTTKPIPCRTRRDMRGQTHMTHMTHMTHTHTLNTVSLHDLTFS